MRYSILALAPFVAAAYGQEASTTEAPTVLPVISGSVTVSSTYTYSNTLTNFLSLTNSDGVVTGMPTLSNAGPQVAVTSQPAAETNVGTVATIPAGLPTGITAIAHGGSNTSTSFFTVSVGPSTTVVLSSTSSTSSAGSGSGSGSETGASGSGGQNPSATGSAGASESSSAADAVKVASGAVLGLGALFVALL
ncbi:hypothetical protein CLAFUW4_00798 [Fulvia fulva]|uniref:Uncharacterized protein n=1 Tax=Passalora fulva TaxID=5499 RepID=A0A9Q8L5A0_PASFU|nr:uncharacterized protein CLAFUR5_00801 [Fulvia fulva]KAK4634230.1 hypothetical protein CLAFUR4_00799 [Fulvia fulva]KAK4636953.1 hypothetical protein CLAFUR0_00800 [Fulvia fulva]UJO10989.1 hypothetical protein CLAFUR5_00801 [Fulvia fulva]WPV10189.1 hypothetical protein CLAFUW4_00798 [Fulvia fulva]WPV23603.1 hypothetical protein CLAFUW7_01018 [Fulvia fulva]